MYDQVFRASYFCGFIEPSACLSIICTILVKSDLSFGIYLSADLVLWHISVKCLQLYSCWCLIWDVLQPLFEDLRVKVEEEFKTFKQLEMALCLLWAVSLSSAAHFPLYSRMEEFHSQVVFKKNIYHLQLDCQDGGQKDGFRPERW